MNELDLLKNIVSSERLVLTRVESGIVELDTHNAYGYKKIPATKIAKKLYPNAKEKNGNLLIPEENCFTCPVTGIYEITVGNRYTYTTNLYHLKKGDTKYFSSDRDSYVYITKVN
jgi:hypothetical protein